MRILIYLFAFVLFAPIAIAGPTNAPDQFCFEMRIGKVVKRVLFSFEDDEWKKGTVKYSGQQGAVPIRLKANKLLRKYAGRPDYRRYDFEEVATGKVSGLYSFSLQGVNFSNAYYLKYKDRKKFKMTRPVVADEDCLSTP